MGAPRGSPLDYQRMQSNFPTATGGFGGPALHSGPAGFQPPSLIERFSPAQLKPKPTGGFDIGTYQQRSQEALSIFGTLGKVPGDIFGTIPSMIDTITGTTIGHDIVNGPLKPIDEFAQKAFSWWPAVVNQTDASIWGIVGNLPDNTEITGELLRAGGYQNVASSEFRVGEQTGGIPIIGGILSALGLGTGPGGRHKTVAEFRQELSMRGFFANEQGITQDPRQVAADLASGRRTSSTFGHALINDDPMVAIAAQIVTDPTNLLFMVPGANLAKGATLPIQIAKLLGRAAMLSRLQRVGVYGEAALSAGRAAEVIYRGGQGVSPLLRGTRAGLGAARPFEGAPLRLAQTVAGAEGLAQATRYTGATLAGLSTVLRNYRRASVAAYGANLGMEQIGGFLHDVTGEPFFGDVQDFALAVQNNNELSDSVAFSLLSAFTLPVKETVTNVLAPVRRVPRGVFGPGDFDEWAKQAGGTKRMVAAFRGKEGVQRFGDWVDVNIARSITLGKEGIPEQIEFSLRSLPSLVDRTNREVTYYRLMAEDMRAKGTINSKMRSEWAKEWYERQSGAVARDEFGKETLVRGVQPYDFNRMVEHWNTFDDVHGGMVRPLFREFGEITTGLRDQPLREEVELATTFLETRKYTDDSGTARVPIESILDMLNTSPTLNAATADAKGFWIKFFNLGRERGKDPTWSSVERQLKRQRDEAIPHNEYFRDVDGFEAMAPEDINTMLRAHGVLRDKRTELSEARAAVERYETTLDPEQNALVQKIRALQADPAATPGERAAAEAAARRVMASAESDIGASFRQIAEDLEAELKAEQEKLIGDATGLGGVYGRITMAAEATTGLVAPLLHPSIKTVDPVERTLLLMLEREMAKASPAYRLKRRPTAKPALDVFEPLQHALGMRNAIGEAVFISGGMSPLGRGINALLRPVPSNELRKGSRGALREDLAPLWTPDLVDEFLSFLEAEIVAVSSKGLGLEMRWFRDIGAITPGRMERLTGDFFLAHGGRFKDAAKAQADIKAKGGMYRIIAKSTSRYGRTLESAAKRGTGGVRKATAQKAFEVYNAWYDTRYLGAMTQNMRVFGRTWYPFGRFVLDPRFWVMNALEGNILAFFKTGVIRRYANEAQGTAASQSIIGRITGDPVERGALLEDIGAGSLYNNSRLDMIAQTMFDRDGVNRMSDELVELRRMGNKADALRKAQELGKKLNDEQVAILNRYGEINPAIDALRSNMRSEAELLRRQAYESDDKARAKELNQRADFLEGESEKAMAEHFMDFAFRAERDGGEKAAKDLISEVSQKMMSADEIAAMSPLLTHLQSVLAATWHDTRSVIYGNPQRRTVERMLNSYWLFWPISYLVKATKWLGDIMYTGSFGHNNNALLGAQYAKWEEEHKRQALTNPAFAALMEANPTLWYTAQMLFPITPGDDIGFGMGRLPRALGAVIEDFVNDRLGTESDVFTLNYLVDDPAAFTEYVTKIGPLFTLDLIQRISRDLGLGQDEERSTELPGPFQPPTIPSTPQ